MECRMAEFVYGLDPTIAGDLGMQMRMEYSSTLMESFLTRNGLTLTSIGSSIQVRGFNGTDPRISTPTAMV